MFAGRQGDFQTGWNVYKIICLCVNMINGKW